LQPLQPNLLSAWVYGSVAKQTDTARSDIDVILVGNDLLLDQLKAEPRNAQEVTATELCNLVQSLISEVQKLIGK
jgi:predicted nucleotidyltransferase